MNKIVVDAGLLDKLSNVSDFAELCDEAGNTIGYFRPLVDKSLYDRVVPPIREEELDEIERDLSGRPLRDILRDLERPE